MKKMQYAIRNDRTGEFLIRYDKSSLKRVWLHIPDKIITDEVHFFDGLESAKKAKRVIESYFISTGHSIDLTIYKVEKVTGYKMVKTR